MNLRMIGLAVVVVAATLLPLAASAGSAHGPGPENGSVPADDAKDDAGLLHGIDAPEISDVIGGADGSDGSTVLDGGESHRPLTAAQCGPELASPEGVEVQTCVLTEGRDTWARTYYRNATGKELTSVLTLMGPGGRTLQTNCAVEAGDEPGTCDTPREPSRGAASAYWAVAEFAASGAAGEGPLVLRSTSNSRTPGRR
ncbi:hypothetical protein [Streptomyces sp. NPDC002889]|uniref:hypothetical protein n=1 Tax=Streptomyces sp. NPDC002889 TaxID=3364669 RepID=UPI00369A291E